MAKVEIGYKLSSEDHGAMYLVRYARRAEEVRFAFGLIWITTIPGRIVRVRPVGG